VNAEGKVVSARIWNPANTLFKTSKREHAECETVTCRLEDCPLRKQGMCAWIGVLGWNACPHGRPNKEKGPTRLARSFGAWLKDRQEKYKGIPTLGQPDNKLAIIGDYVFLPYAHMDMCEAVPFLKHGGAFCKGCAFIPISAWTLDTVLRLIDFRPQALMGGEITSYQKESVPKFIRHMREVTPDMFAALVKVRPQYDVATNHVGRKARLWTLKPDIEWDAKVNDKYPVHWKWDGKALTTYSDHVYSSTWGGNIAASCVQVRVVPVASAVVKVQDNAWVLPDTEFVD
jgi:hypothetical protein